MYNTLFDGEILETVDLAKQIITKGINLPFYEIIAEETDQGISFQIKHEDEYLEHLGKADLHGSGVYCIYNESKDKCLYVGYTNVSFYNRIYRFLKELAGKSRDDEGHSGAKKALEDGVKFTDKFYVKFLSKYEFPDREKNCHWNENDVDKYIAHMLGSHYNSHTSW